MNQETVDFIATKEKEFAVEFNRIMDISIKENRLIDQEWEALADKICKYGLYDIHHKYNTHLAIQGFITSL